MKFAESELRQITEDTWRIVLGEELEHAGGPLTPDDIDDPIAASAQIAGDWQLAVVVYAPVELARHAAGIMFDSGGSTPTLEDVHDTMCEIVNIVAGNVKGVLTGSSHLSLPHLIKGQDFKLMFPRHILLSQAGFYYQGHPLVVMLLGEDKLGARLQERGERTAAR